MPKISVDFDVYCAKCGAGICHNVEVDDRGGVIRLYIDPCDDCLKNEYDEGYSDGKEEANE